LLLGVVPKILPGVVVVTSIATIARCVAGDNLLLGEVVKVLLSASDGVGGLNSASGGEGPAGAALALVLDADHVASRNPVDF